MSKLSVYGIYDVEQKHLVGVYENGTAKEQKEAAEAQVARFQEHVGDGKERDLRVVTISEA